MYSRFLFRRLDWTQGALGTRCVSCVPCLRLQLALLSLRANALTKSTFKCCSGQDDKLAFIARTPEQLRDAMLRNDGTQGVDELQCSRVLRLALLLVDLRSALLQPRQSRPRALGRCILPFDGAHSKQAAFSC